MAKCLPVADVAGGTLAEHAGMPRLLLIPIVLFGFGLCVVTCAFASEVSEGQYGASTTNAGGNFRTGWYPNEPSISPETVSPSTGSFGRLWKQSVEGPVYAQPLLADHTLLVATEADDLYGLNPETGEKVWSRKVGEAWNPEELACYDITPSVGVTATPVIDPETGIAYFTYEAYDSSVHELATVRWYMSAVDVATGKVEEGFPLELQGSAQNAPAKTFDAAYQLQRPGLLLLKGVVYAAFGSQCDDGDWDGWVFGVATGSGPGGPPPHITARWVADETGEQDGIWQSGAGIASDGPETILLCTGNGSVAEVPTPGHDPPANIGEATIELHVEADGSLKATDFFAPVNAKALSEEDDDWASSGVTVLPPEYFGPGTSTPHMALSSGKDAFVYLMNLEELGGFEQGPPPSEDVIQRLPEGGFVPTPTFPYGGVWSRPGVWPGEGGWVYIPTATEGPAVGGSSTQGRLLVFRYSSAGGQARLVPVASSADSAEASFGFGSSAPVITSNGVESGSGLVWIVWEPAGSHGDGKGAQLRAYETVPGSEGPRLVWSEAVGNWTKFESPGVAEGRIFVGTYNEVIAFGPSLTTAEFNAPATTLGASSEAELKLTASKPVTVSALGSSSSQFALGTASRALPAELKTGETLEVPVTFKPAAAGTSTAHALVTLDTGEGSKTLQFPLQGTSPAPSSPSSPEGTGTQGTTLGTPGTSLGTGLGILQSPAEAPQATKAAGGIAQAPHVTVLSTKLLANRHGAFALRLHCASGSGACVGTVTIARRIGETSRGHSKRRFVDVTLAIGSFRIAAGHEGTVELRLSARGLALLKRSLSLGTTATVEVRVPAGATRQSRTQVRIRLAAEPR
jgi:iron transport multicopper oxidase